MRFAPTTFRPGFGRVLCVIVVAIAVAGLAGFVVTADLIGLLRYGWGLALLAAVAVALFWLPSLAVAEHEITVKNVFSTLHVPWTAIERIDTKYALTLYTPLGRIAAWASPAPSRYAGQVSSSRDAGLPGAGLGGSIRPGDLLNTASGAAAYVIRSHWDQLRDDGLLENSVIEVGSLRRDVHWPTLVVLSVLTIATVLGILL